MSCNGCKWQCLYGVCNNKDSERYGEWANMHFICDKREVTDGHAEELPLLWRNSDNLQG